MQNDAKPLFSAMNRCHTYSYLLDWQWPEHIESLLRRLLYLSLQADAQGLDGGESKDLDYLEARLVWLISVYPDSNPAILNALAQQQSPAFLERIAENPSASPVTLEYLSSNESGQVRAAVAENINTSEAVLKKLACDVSADVRHVMAENHRLEPQILQQLSEDENCYVANRAARTLKRLAAPELSVFPLRRSPGLNEGGVALLRARKS